MGVLLGVVAMKIEEALEVCQNIWSSQRNAIKLEIERQDFEKMVILEEVGQSHFGGLPDVPEGFEWPSYEYVEKKYLPFGKVEDGETKLCHLHFIAQFNLEQISLLDKDNLLPKKGLLLFFYDCYNQCWGYDPKEKGSWRVLYFENIASLKRARTPEGVDPDFIFPKLAIKAHARPNLIDFEDYYDSFGPIDAYDFAKARYMCLKHLDCNLEQLKEEDPQEYEDFVAQLSALLSQEECSDEIRYGEGADDYHQLLGYPAIIQNAMTIDCELLRQGFNVGRGWSDFPVDVKQKAQHNGPKNWLLLFELDGVTDDQSDFELMFGDCGMIYFYIRKDELAAGNFDGVWLHLQCY